MCRLSKTHPLTCRVRQLCTAASLCVLKSSYKLLLSPSPELKFAKDSATNLESRPRVRKIVGPCLHHPNYI